MFSAAHPHSTACPTQRRSRGDPRGSNAGAHQSRDVSPFGDVPRGLHKSPWVSPSYTMSRLWFPLRLRRGMDAGCGRRAERSPRLDIPVTQLENSFPLQKDFEIRTKSKQS